MTEPDILALDTEEFPESIVSAVQHFTLEEFACYDRYCAPPPIGKGGSSKKGGGPSAEDAPIVATPQSRKLARGIFQRAKSLEPEISAHLSSLVGDNTPETYETPPPAQMYGFAHRLKSMDKIAEKIERVVVEKGFTREQAAEDIKDAVRYTVHYPDDTFGRHAQNVVDTLRAENASVIVKNTWPPESGVPYKGINVQVVRHDGVKFELQFHTPESQRVKDQMHTLYEEQRVLPRTNPRWQQIELQMERLADRIPIPTGAMEVFELVDNEETVHYFKAEADGIITALAKLIGFDTWVNHGAGWIELPILRSLAEDTGWIPVEEEALDALLEKFQN